MMAPRPPAEGEPGRRSRPGWAVLLLGAGALVAEAYVLTGRAPQISVMRGGGAMTLGALIAAAAAFGAAVMLTGRRIGRRRGRALLAGGCAFGALVAAVVVLRHLPAATDEFRLPPSEQTAVRALLGGVLGLFATLWLWAGLADDAAALRTAGMRGAPLRAALRRRGVERFLAPLKTPTINLALIVGAIVIALIMVEAALRVIEGGSLLSFENLVTRKTDLLTIEGANRYDPRLGWVLADNQADGATGNFSTGEHGARMNGRTIVPVPHHGVVVSGDSFTAGSEVRNWESWPAQLEALLGEPVVNAATGGWGSDQIVLRAESLIPVLQPRAIVVSFLADDILRAGYETFGGGNKPYFTVDDGALVAHNAPVPRFAGQISEIGWLRGLLGFSHLVAYAMEITGHAEWWFGTVNRRVANDIVEISCLLLKRLKATADAERIALVFVLQFGPNLIVPLDEEPAYAGRVAACARTSGIPTIDTWSTLQAVRQRDALKTVFNVDPARGQYGHMSPAGNALIARMVAEALRADGAIAPDGRTR
jgi:lysophospholipase L1-like esterase